MKVKKILALSLIPLNSLLLFFVLVENLLAVPAWLQVFGRMHPLMLHFPIVLALLFAVMATLRTKDLTEWFLLLAAVTCSLTALMGFFLSRDGGYDAETIALHKWTGIILSFLLFAIYNFRGYLFNRRFFQLATAAAVALVVTATSHFGGEITHGENFVLQPVTPEKIKMIPSLEEAFVFADLVQPVLDKKCVSCHNSKKAKGELIMETRDLLLQGGKSGNLWDSTSADLGLMMKRIHLPLDDKKHMPPSGKPQLTEDEIAILHEWISSGADFDKRVIELEPHDSLLLIAKKILKPSSEVKYDFPAADEKLIANLTNSNRLVEPIAIGSPALKVSFYNRTRYESAALKELNQLAPQVVEINLINMPVSDEDIKSLKTFINLRKLYLNYSSITGKTLNELQVLPNLQVLSLTGTKIEFPYLRSLQNFPKLNTVYLWGTSVTTDQIAELKKLDKRIAYQSGFSGDTLIMQLTPPIIDNEEQIIYSPLSLRLKHNIPGTEIRYTLDGSDPDSIHSPLYNGDVQLSSAATVKTKAFKPGWISSPVKERFFFKSTYSPDTVILETMPDERYKSALGKTLYDKEKSDMNVLSTKWLGYNKNDLSALVVLDSSTTIKNVTLSTLSNQGSYIFPAAKIEIWGGLERTKMKLLATVVPTQTLEGELASNQPIECNFPPLPLKYIRVFARPLARIPSWHPGRGQKAYIFLDELFIN